jgi:hypothetical protein
MTINGPPPAYYFEDRTGLVAGSDFDEVYDRAFLRVSATPQRTPHALALMVYNMGRRSTKHGDRDGRHYYQEPVVVLDFGPKSALGTLHFAFDGTKASVPMSQYLRKMSMFGRYILSVRCVSLCSCLATAPSTGNSRRYWMEMSIDGVIGWSRDKNGLYVSHNKRAHAHASTCTSIIHFSINHSHSV